MDKRQLSNMKKIELLAPAGDLHRCKTAIRYGADAVYIGGQNFSLRSRASNYTMDDIREACAFAKKYGAHIHVTVNIIPHEEDFEGLKQYLIELQEAGVTAIIAASVSIMKLAKEVAPKLEVHCSTQMSVTNAETIHFLKNKLNIDRSVLARECSMEQVKEITKNSPVDTEAFIHGGMCVNISGRCTLSNRMTLRDANRGGCAQSCRWTYHLYDGDQELSNQDMPFTMGSKDLWAADQIADLIAAGVTSLKIEGRMKTEYYVASIVSAYRHLIDEIYENGGPLSEERMQYHRNEILKGENRSVCTGFYPGEAKGDTIIYHLYDNSCVNHGFLGIVKGYDSERQCALIETRNAFDLGTEVEVLSPGKLNRQFKVEKIESEKGEILPASRRPMVNVYVSLPFEVEVGDIIRRS